jgi:uncharacterized membrane protein
MERRETVFGRTRERFAGRYSDAEARVLCYLLGPISGAFILHFREYAVVWSIRFHAFHSILMAGLWGVVWSVLRLIEGVSPWFLGTLARELRFAATLGFAVIWGCLVVTAYQGDRCAVVPMLHAWAVRLARRFEKRVRGRNGPASAPNPPSR